MSNDRKLPKTYSALPSINYKHIISLVILLLVTSSTSQSPSDKYECPRGCECNETTFSAKCDDLNSLIASYSRKQHKSRNNFMPIKSLDLSNNHLSKLTNQLELLVNLTELNLSHNELTQVQKLNFDHLEKLDLSFNRITSAKLKKIPKNIVHLDLAYNEITYLPLDFMKLKSLRSLELAGNPLNCTCNTLHVRNWITYHHVWSTNHILCTSPSIVKGQPWLQARQNDICIEPSSTTTQRSKYNWDNYEDDNEIMMGDQPQEYQDDVEYDDEEEDEEKSEKKDEVLVEDEEQMKDEAAVGDEEQVKDEVAVDEDEPEYDEEKSETKDPFADPSEAPATDDDEKPVEDEDKPAEDEKEESDDDDFIPVTPESGHYEGSTVEPEAVSKHFTDLEEGSGFDASTTSEQPIEDTDESGSGAIPIIFGDLDIFEDQTEAPIDAHREGVPGSSVETGEDKAAITDGVSKASTDDNTATYILLGILALCLISLMVFVAMKNRQEKNRNRRGYDVEKNGNGATELQDMDKRLLGKPVDRNGNGHGKPEQTPLINDLPVHKENRPATHTSFQPPKINVDEPKAAPRENNKSQQSLYDNTPNGNGHVEPVHQGHVTNGHPQSPDSDEEVFHPADDINGPASLNVSPEAPKRYSPIYTPVSPRSERYSPVYSPETGRVKIKLTETPKPKTPLVVTRSRSRAGEYVNTPNVN